MEKQHTRAKIIIHGKLPFIVSFLCLFIHFRKFDLTHQDYLTENANKIS